MGDKEDRRCINLQINGYDFIAYSSKVGIASIGVKGCAFTEVAPLGYDVFRWLEDSPVINDIADVLVSGRPPDVLALMASFYITDQYREAIELKSTKEKEEVALRYDDGKPPMDLIPGDALLEVAKILGFGAEKYAPRNWEKGMKWSKCHASLMRHLTAWSMGEDYDKESGRLHIGHVMWNAMVLVSYTLRGVGTDDRYKYSINEESKEESQSSDKTP